MYRSSYMGCVPTYLIYLPASRCDELMPGWVPTSSPRSRDRWQIRSKLLQYVSITGMFLILCTLRTNPNELVLGV